MSASPVLFHPSCSDISNNMEIMEVANGGECVPSLRTSTPPLFEPYIKTEEEEKTILRSQRQEYLGLVESLMAAEDIVFEKLNASKPSSRMALYFSTQINAMELKEMKTVRSLQKGIEKHRQWTTDDVVCNGEEYIKEVCLMNECVQRDIIASFEHNEWKIYLPQEKNSESFHFQTILRECLKDVATWLRDYLFMSMTTLRNLSRKIYLEALVIPKEEPTN